MAKKAKNKTPKQPQGRSGREKVKDFVQKNNPNTSSVDEPTEDTVDEPTEDTVDEPAEDTVDEPEGDAKEDTPKGMDPRNPNCGVDYEEMIAAMRDLLENHPYVKTQSLRLKTITDNKAIIFRVNATDLWATLNKNGGCSFRKTSLIKVIKSLGDDHTLSRYFRYYTQTGGIMQI